MTAEPDAPLARDDRLRRCMDLCCLVAQNMAYHRARRSGGWADEDEDVWTTADSNFLDFAVVAWCALFADDSLKRDKPAEQGWRRMLPEADHEAFERELLAAMDLSAAEFAKLIRAARRYRDKFVAHLDSERSMASSHMEAALRATRRLYNRIWASEIDPNRRGDALPDLDEVYGRALADGIRVYRG